jgi:hypothetical protein
VSGARGLGWGLITDVLDVLEKHGYHCADDQHTGRAIGLLGDLARIYDGTQETPSGPYTARPQATSEMAAAPAGKAAAQDAGAVAAAEARTILAALDEAADHNRDRAANCGDCADQSCGACQFRLAAARDYDRAATRLITAQDASKPAEPVPRPEAADLPGVGIRPQPLAEMEAGQ